MARRPDRPLSGADGGGADRPPGMLDVARLAGVSHQTVSRVLNDFPSVRPATRQRVQQAIAALGYRRNPAARALATNRSSTIGLLTSSSSRSGPVSTLVAVEEAARAARMYVSIVGLSVYDPDSVHAAFDHFLDQGVEGIIAIAPVLDAVEAARALAPGLPMVIVTPQVPTGGPSLHVAVDQRRGARMVVRHLLELGHRRIAHLSGPAAWLDASEREAGWRAELGAHGVAPGPLLGGDWTAASGFDAAVRLLAEPGPTAVFAANDLMALGLVRGLVEGGVRVPEDVSVAGFDDIEVAAYALPPLTTVRQDFAELGRVAVRLLLARLAGEEPPPATWVDPVLTVRNSTAPSSAPLDARLV